MLQRSEEWFNARIGRFTASEADRLLGKITLKATLKKIEGFAQEKASEMYFGLEEESYISLDMQRGIDLEPLAFEKFSKEKNLDFIDVANAPFIPIGEHAGASPDGILSNGENLEIKCPRLPTFNKLILTNEINPKYYAQMQMQMLALETDKTHFYNYVIHDGKEYSYTLEVGRDEEVIKQLEERIIIAAEKKEAYYDVLLKTLG